MTHVWNHLRRFAIMIVAVVAASVSIVAPARADTWGGWYFLRNSHTANCLATDYSAAVYTFPGCNVGQLWRFQYLDAYPGWAVIWNQVTSRCLMASSHPQVVSSGACDGSRAEFRWHWYYSNLQNAKQTRSCTTRARPLSFSAPTAAPGAYGSRWVVDAAEWDQPTRVRTVASNRFGSGPIGSTLSTVTPASRKAAIRSRT